MVAAVAALAGCALNADLGVIQRGPARGTGVSGTAHAGIGAVPDKILALDVDTRIDVAPGGSRLAFGASVLGGLPVFGGGILARVGFWKAAVSSSRERVVVPTFELAGFVPLVEHGDGGPHRTGASAYGVMFGLRDDLDVDNYVTVFVGLALFMVPGP